MKSYYRQKIDRQMARCGSHKPAPEVAAPGFTKREYLTNILARPVIMTDHAREQNFRRNGLTIDQMKTFFQDMKTVIAGIDWVEYNQEVFVYSYRWQRGMIIARRNDFKNTNQGCFVVVTVYPYGKAAPIKPDTEVFRG